MLLTVSSRCGWITITTRERRMTNRSSTSKIRFRTRDRLNAKFVSCCGRLEVHVVQVRDAEGAARTTPMKLPSSCECTASRPLAERTADDGDGEEGVERNLCERGADPDLADQRRTQRAKYPETGDGDVLSERVNHQIYGVPELDQRGIRWNSLNGVPLGSKKGSGAIIRIFTAWLRGKFYGDGPGRST